MFFSLVALLAAVATADPADPCKLTTTLNGKTLNYDINILKRTYEPCVIAWSLLIDSRSDGPATPKNLHANWYAIETHADDASQDNTDDYTYFFNLCGPLLNMPAFLTARVAAFDNDIGVLQV